MSWQQEALQRVLAGDATGVGVILRGQETADLVGLAEACAELEGMALAHWRLKRRSSSGPVPR